MHKMIFCLPLLLAAAPAAAQDRDFCADRPGLGTPACTLAPGQAMIEVGLAGWDHLSDPYSVEDDLTFGDALLRVGLDPRTEVQIGLGGYASNRLRDRASGLIVRTRGAGDVTIALRRGIAGPNGPVALHVFATLPTGAKGIGAGDWSGGVLLPADLSLPNGFELDLTPELDLVPNSSGSGHHAAWGGVVGVSHDLGRKVSVEAELAAWRDEDPAGASTDARAAISLAWQVSPSWQLDFEADHGLTSTAPRHSLAVGFAHRF